jgi:hypothetical protein
MTFDAFIKDTTKIHSIRWIASLQALAGELIPPTNACGR